MGFLRYWGHVIATALWSSLDIGPRIIFFATLIGLPPVVFVMGKILGFPDLAWVSASMISCLVFAGRIFYVPYEMDRAKNEQIDTLQTIPKTDPAILERMDRQIAATENQSDSARLQASIEMHKHIRGVIGMDRK